MAEIPAPLRAAIGLVAEAVDRVKSLPEQAPDLPVQIVSGAMQASMRAQQRYAELTSRGDQLLSQLRGTPDEAPPWASFDEEVDAAQAQSAAQRLGSDADTADDLEAAIEDPVAPSAPPKSTSPRGPSGRGSAADAEPAKRTTGGPRTAAPAGSSPPARTPAGKKAAGVKKAAPARKTPAKRAATRTGQRPAAPRPSSAFDRAADPLTDPGANTPDPSGS